jgi:hypothetical protein
MSGSCLNQGSDDLNSSGGLYTEGGHPQLVVACLMCCLGRQELPSRYQIRTGVNPNTTRTVGIAIPNTLLAADDG